MRDRIKKIINECVGTHRGAITQFAQTISAGTGLVGNWLKGTSSPGTDYRNIICEKYGISRDWLDKGKGSMLLNEKSISQKKEQEYSEIESLRKQLIEKDKEIAEKKADIDFLKNEIKEKGELLKSTMEHAGKSQMYLEEIRNFMAYAPKNKLVKTQSIPQDEPEISMEGNRGHGKGGNSGRETAKDHAPP